MTTPEERSSQARVYLERRSISRAHGSSLRKLNRADRIRQGQRPRVQVLTFTLADFLRRLRYCEFHVESICDAYKRAGRSPDSFARLHPTKGFRLGEAV